VLAGRETMLDDLELLEIERAPDPEQHPPWKEELERELPNPALVDELVTNLGAVGDEFAVMPAAHLSDALEIFEFVSYFSEQLGCARLSWREFEEALMSPSCCLFHGLHVQLVRILFQDLPGGERPFRGRPLNSLTWPELLRQYLLMLELEHSSDGLESLSETMGLGSMCELLEAEAYEQVPLDARLRLLGLNLQLALETNTLRLFVDDMCEQSIRSAAQKKEAFQMKLRGERDGVSAPPHADTLSSNSSSKADAKAGSSLSEKEAAAAASSREDFEGFATMLQETLVGALRGGSGSFGAGSGWASESERALEMVAITVKGFVAKAATAEKPGAAGAARYLSLKTEMCEELRVRLLRCSSGDSSSHRGDEWRQAVVTLLEQAQDAVMVKQMAASAAPRTAGQGRPAALGLSRTFPTKAAAARGALKQELNQDEDDDDAGQEGGGGETRDEDEDEDARAKKRRRTRPVADSEEEEDDEDNEEDDDDAGQEGGGGETRDEDEDEDARAKKRRRTRPVADSEEEEEDEDNEEDDDADEDADEEDDEDGDEDEDEEEVDHGGDTESDEEEEASQDDEDDAALPQSDGAIARGAVCRRLDAEPVGRTMHGTAVCRVGACGGSRAAMARLADDGLQRAEEVEFECLPQMDGAGDGEPHREEGSSSSATPHLPRILSPSQHAPAAQQHLQEQPASFEQQAPHTQQDQTRDMLAAALAAHTARSSQQQGVQQTVLMPHLQQIFLAHAQEQVRAMQLPPHLQLSLATGLAAGQQQPQASRWVV